MVRVVRKCIRGLIPVPVDRSICQYLFTMSRAMIIEFNYQYATVLGDISPYCVTHSLTLSFHALTLWLSHSLTHSLTRWLSHPLTHSNSFTHSLNYSLADCPTHLLIHLLIYSFTHLLIHLFRSEANEPSSSHSPASGALRVHDTCVPLDGG